MRSLHEKHGCNLQLRLHIKGGADILLRRATTHCRDGLSEDVLVTRKRNKDLASENTEFATEPVQAERFSKARSARSASMLEDYTELIADLIAVNGEARTTDIARRLGVAHPTASKTIARLKREGLATARPYRGIFLTKAGQAMAKSVRQRHRLVVDLLVAVGAPREAAEADAEGIEHYVSAATLRAFEAFLREGGRR
jgi:DtxR family transcriptional regulator, manganese transport regulator